MLAVGPVVCEDGEMSGDSGDEREVEPAAAGSGRQKASQPVNTLLLLSV